MMLNKMRNKFSKRQKSVKQKDSLNEFLAHIYNELKMSKQRRVSNNTDTTTLTNNRSSSIDEVRENSENESLFTANNSDFDKLTLNQAGFFIKKAPNEEEFDWECSTYLKLIDYEITPQIMFANKHSLEMTYDTRHLKSLGCILSMYNQSEVQNVSLFSLFLHDLFSFVSSLNLFIIHNTLSLDNIFYDSVNSKFYVTDLQNVVLKSTTDEYMSDTSSDSSSSELLKEYFDLICLHKLLTKNLRNNTLLRLVNRIFGCYIPTDYSKLYKQLC